eukprot:jgi/Ulvmu1/10748/UM068_0038.1
MPGVEKGRDGVAQVCTGKYRPIGFTVRVKNGHRVGVVEEIIDLDYVCQLWVADELAIPLLRQCVEERSEVKNVVETHTVHHRIPLVPDFLLDVDCKAKKITVKLPSGLIQLGREELYIRVLKRELEPYIAELPNRFREKVRGERELPRYKDLRKHGRVDLVSLIKKAGGLAKVAQTLGCRAASRPRGYYQDLDNLDWDLSCFIASGWVQLPTALDPLLTGSSHSDSDDMPESQSDTMEESADDSHSTQTQKQPTSDASEHLTVEATETGRSIAVPMAAGRAVPRNDATIAHAAALVSVDCGDELIVEQDRELYSFDQLVVANQDRSSHMTTITHAGKIQPGSVDSSMALQAGYDAPDDRHIMTDADDADELDYDSEDDEDEHEVDDWPADDFGSANSLVGEWYYYNTITQQVSIEEPQVPSVHSVGKALVRVEDETQRFMPSQASVVEAGRYDLLHAIRLHGGFAAVASMLQRERLFYRQPVVTDEEAILCEVQVVQRTLGLAPEEFPTREQLEACQRPEVVRWITACGGFKKVAVRLGMRTKRMMSCITPAEVAEEVSSFMDQHPPPNGEPGDWRYLPSLQHLHEAGEEDLARKLKRSDRSQVARLLGVEPRRRGWQKGRVRKALVLPEAAALPHMTPQLYETAKPFCERWHTGANVKRMMACAHVQARARACNGRVSGRGTASRVTTLPVIRQVRVRTATRPAFMW